MCCYKKEEEKSAFACPLEFGENLFFISANLSEREEKIRNNHFSVRRACSFRKTHQPRGESKEEN